MFLSQFRLFDGFSAGLLQKLCTDLHEFIFGRRGTTKWLEFGDDQSRDTEQTF